METTPLPEKSDGLVEERPTAFLSAAPRSGELSPFAQKLIAESFVWLCSIVVFGSTADFANGKNNICTALCKFAIATGVISFFIISFVLFGQYLVASSRVEKSGWFSTDSEKRFMIFLTAWWTIGAACLSALEP
eukprot:GO256218.1.p1 GENE.GO256218.1~~GO256218.1.p1  ORF type:complete len:157 (+),score=22.04 GO256218.1:70-471(+)